ncbi:YoaK family protein [Apilactobacillus kunkeei]|uniref:YoaK family protein n=1 Tax=Apilactobacillus kunkeei TaxID=148814 RepID=UPI0006B23E8C|nr:YoaK family protein [Apilactobacillus kunkeei]
MKNKDIFTHPLIAILLAITSGGIDAYTFIEQGGVFAGLQTGNSILFGISLANHDFDQSLKYIFSIIFFALGIVIIKVMQRKLDSINTRKVIIMFYEIVIIMIVGLLVKDTSSVLIVGLLSLVSAAQLQEFKLLKGNPFNPLMMTGNISKIANNAYLALVDHDKKAQSLLIDTIMVITSFILGTFIMGIVDHYLNAYSVLVLIIPLSLVIIFNFINRK